MRLGLWRRQRWRRGRHRYFWLEPRTKVLGLIGIVIVLFFLLLSYFEICLRPNLQLLARNKTALYANQLINDAVTRVTDSYAADGVFHVLEKDDTGKIDAYHVNTIMVNRFCSDVSKDIYDHLNDIEGSTLRIPLGNVLTKHAIFSRLGPRIPVRIKPLGFAQIDYTTQFTSAGINQVKHEILLKVKLTIVAYIPGATTKVSVNSSIPIDETILMGKVPDDYTNFETSKEDVKDNFIDIAR